MIDLKTLSDWERMHCADVLARAHDRPAVLGDRLDPDGMDEYDLMLVRLTVQDMRDRKRQERLTRAALQTPFAHELPEGVVPMRRTRARPVGISKVGGNRNG